MITTRRLAPAVPRIPRRHGVVRALAMLLCLLAAGPGAEGAATGAADGALILHVAPSGSDAWSGRLAQPKADRSDGPLATIIGARNALRALRKKGPLAQRVIVEIADGRYPLSSTLVFTPEDSGTERFPVHYRAAKGATPVLSGGRVITGWRKQASGPFWTAEIPEIRERGRRFRQLFVNGKRYTLARYPDEPTPHFRFKSKSCSESKGTAVCEKGDIRPWRRQDPVEAVLFRTWDISRYRVASYNKATGILTLRLPKGPHPITHWGGDRRYVLENSLSFCNLPGEWFLDTQRATAYLRPLPEHREGTTEVIAPALELLVRFAGDAKRPVQHLSFEGLTFRHAAWTLPPEGHAGRQAGGEIGAAIEGDFVESCAFVDCRFERLGRYALWLRQGCRGNRITRCEFADLGGGAVRIGENVRQAVRLEHETRDNEISDNHIHDITRVWTHCVGIWIGPASHNRIIHNHLHHMNYSGISVGWCWAPKASMCHHNLVAYNYIHDVMQALYDGGGIYTLGLQEGTVIRNNVIHDSLGGAPARWANGIYNDNGSSDMLIENNIVHRIGSFGIQMGINERNVVRNNIFAFAKDCIYAVDGKELVCERNILYGGRSLLNLRVKANQFRSDYNLFHNPKGADFSRLSPRAVPEKLIVGGAGYTYDTWKAAGNEAHSIVADPLFADPERGDFTLKPGSPALTVGFKPIDVSTVGIRKTPQ